MTNTFDAEKQDTAQAEQKHQPINPVVAIIPFKNLTGDPGKDYFALGFSEELSVEITKFEDLTALDGIHLSGLEQTKLDKMEFVSNLGVRFVIEGSVNLNNEQVKILVKLSDIIRKKQIWVERYLRNLSITNLVEIQENIACEVACELGSEYGII
jgi:TolB-like protein